MIKVIVDGKEVEIERGQKLIKAVEAAGVKVPTLCYHKALSPYGACRLCVVEVGAKGRSKSVQASCTYPASDGLEVLTNTDRVRRVRKIALELLLARCPSSETIQLLAAEYGVHEPRIEKKNEDCINCGLCIRMCEERMGRKVLGFTGRGPRKKLEPPFSAKNPACWACGACDFICPVGKKVTALTTDLEFKPIGDRFNGGLSSRAVAHILYPQAVPAKAILDPENCIKLNYDQCGICYEVCEPKAIKYDDKEKEVEINAGAIILAPGFKPYAPEEKEDLGYKKFKNVITSLEFERILCASGPYCGEIKRPSDGKHPHKIAFIQCVGSREKERNWCSSVCCMYATKEAIMAKEHAGESLMCDIYFMDVRAYSKGFEQYYDSAKKLGINYIRCRVPKLEENPENKNIIVSYLTEDDKKAKAEYDMVILSIGLCPPEDAKKIAEKFGIELNEFGFATTSTFKPVETKREGIYIAGPFTEPKDIPETVMQATASASKALTVLSDVKGQLIKPMVFPEEIDVAGQEPRIGVFVCHCGTNIAGVVNVPEVVEYAKTLPNVVYAVNTIYACSNDTQELIKQKIKEYNLNRIIVSACTPRTHEPLFRNTVKEASLNPYLFEMANIRDQNSWVHMQFPDAATKKAKDLVRMAVAKAKLLEPLQNSYIDIIKNALVIGGGVAGMKAALELANQGYKVFLLEKTGELGGNLRNIYYLLDGENPKEEMEKIIKEVQENKNIEVYFNAKIDSVEGSVGRYKTKIQSNGKEYVFEHGVVIIAMGGKEYEPKEYMYGEDERVLTQRQLEEKIAKKNIKIPETVVMIQCVGSREGERPSCSRICCGTAIKNALKIKEISPKTNVFILYRDVRAYGFKEKYYTLARDKGVIFIRWDIDDGKPAVYKNNGKIYIDVKDKILNMEHTIPADLVVLSTGVMPNEDHKEVAQHFKVPVTAEGYFLEAHMKLRPVDFATDGVFLAGLAHFPKTIDESIIQAQASAARASTILSKDKLELEATISQVIDENCDGCAYCVDTCPYKAITLLEYVFQGSIKKTVEANESLCKGCGTCMATCPKKGILVKGFTLEQLQAQVFAALEQS